jgi:hypothetical protein
LHVHQWLSNAVESACCSGECRYLGSESLPCCIQLSIQWTYCFCFKTYNDPSDFYDL